MQYDNWLALEQQVSTVNGQLGSRVQKLTTCYAYYGRSEFRNFPIGKSKIGTSTAVVDTVSNTGW